MASVVSRPNGRKEIQFTGADRRRRTVRLGKVSLKAAEADRVRVEHLLAAQITGHPLDAETARWVAALTEERADLFARAGLVPRRESARLGAFLDDYVAGRADAKPGTLKTLRTARGRLVRFFGADRELRSVTEGDADRFAVHLKARCAPATAGRTIKHARQFFKAACRRGLAELNPFATVKAPGQKNAARGFHVDRETTRRLLEACPDYEWRLIVALTRYGGLRCPSELARLEWADVHWQLQRFLVKAPKTEHTEGGGERWVPIFPELRPYLDEAWEKAAPGAAKVFARAILGETNLRTRLLLILRKAGLSPWPRLFQNLRASRETELAETYPLHVVCAWIGNSPKVAAEHYLQVTDEHFRRGAAGPGAQNPTQPAAHGAVPEGAGAHAEKGEKRQGAPACGFVPAGAPSCTNADPLPRGHGGPRTSGRIVAETGPGVPGRAKADADGIDPGLALVNAAWPTLDARTRRAIVRLVEGEG